MKPVPQVSVPPGMVSFSTLNSGLRDETASRRALPPALVTFSTLNSGLRDETGERGGGPVAGRPFSTLNSGLRDETYLHRVFREVINCLSVPSTRAYAMKPTWVSSPRPMPTSFSTLNSGLRDETAVI